MNRKCFSTQHGVRLQKVHVCHLPRLQADHGVLPLHGAEKTAGTPAADPTALAGLYTAGVAPGAPVAPDDSDDAARGTS